jgi:hypothetical protein
MSYNMIRMGIIILLLTTVCICVLLVEGCTVIGFTIGSNKDNNTPETESLPYLNWFDVEEGTNIKVTLKDDESIEGKYLSASPMGFEESKKQYQDWYQEFKDSIVMPEIDDTVVFKLSKNSYEGHFFGFDLNNVWVRFIDKKALGTMLLTDIIEIRDRHNNIVNGENLKRNINARLIPVSMLISFREKNDTLFIPVMEIEEMAKVNSRKAKWVGALIGLPIDAFAVLIVYSLSNIDLSGF